LIKGKINSTAFNNAEIPSDWEVKRISNLGIVYTGNTPPTNDFDNYGNEFMFVSPTDLGDGKYIRNTVKKLSKKGFDISRKFPKGTVLFTCIGSTIGKSGIAIENLTSNQQINAIVVNEKNSNEFVYLPIREKCY
jgi:type I restriction enzyme S subunit